MPYPRSVVPPGFTPVTTTSPAQEAFAGGMSTEELYGQGQDWIDEYLPPSFGSVVRSGLETVGSGLDLGSMALGSVGSGMGLALAADKKREMLGAADRARSNALARVYASSAFPVATAPSAVNPAGSLEAELMADPAHAAKVREAGRAAPLPSGSGYRAFRMKDGRIVFTNLPGEYGGEERVDDYGFVRGGGEELSPEAGRQAARAIGRRAPYTPPPDPTNLASRQSWELVQRAAAAPDEGNFSQVELKPGGIDPRSGLPVATPGYWASVAGPMQDAIGVMSLAQRAAYAGLGPREAAELEAMVKQRGNYGLEMLRYGVETISRIDQKIQALTQTLKSKQVAPELVEQTQNRINELAAQRDSVLNLFSLINRQMYIPGQAQGVQEADTTPGS